jgi:hypothetical protein
MPKFNELNEQDREEYLKQLDQQQFDKQVDEKARLDSLQKLKDQGLGQQFEGHGGNSFNTRRYGPYQLNTMLEQSNSFYNNNENKLGKIINTVRFLGGQHSPEDAKKIAEELKWPGEKVDYENIGKRLSNLKENQHALFNLQDRVMESSNGPELGPMWYEESPEEKQKKLDRFNKLKTSLK